jgi:hypothetical protein
MDRGLEVPAPRAIDLKLARTFQSRAKPLITAETFAPLFRNVA